MSSTKEIISQRWCEFQDIYDSMEDWTPPEISQETREEWHAQDLERYWVSTLPRDTGSLMADTCQDVVHEQLSQAYSQKQKLELLIAEKSMEIASTPKEQRWLKEVVLERGAVSELMDVDRQINRLRRYSHKRSLQEGVRTEQIEQAKSFPIENIIQLKRSGSRWKGLCPLHDEKTPSFVVYPNNRYHCFGCQENGDAIDLIMKVEGVNFNEAINRLL